MNTIAEIFTVRNANSINTRVIVMGNVIADLLILGPVRIRRSCWNKFAKTGEVEAWNSETKDTFFDVHSVLVDCRLNYGILFDSNHVDTIPSLWNALRINANSVIHYGCRSYKQHFVTHD